MLAVLLPPGVVTTTPGVPGLAASCVMQIIEVEVTAVTVQATLPIITLVEPLTKLVPVTVKVVPPANGPPMGEIWLMVGTPSGVTLTAADGKPAPMLLTASSMIE